MNQKRKMENRERIKKPLHTLKNKSKKEMNKLQLQ
jgi:hypothetical protein